MLIFMAKNDKIKILAICGSLRKGSFNKALINEAIKQCPEDAEISFFDISGLPLFNQDLEDNIPKEVLEFKKAIEESDALLIATQEYNRSVPGVLKNAI
ncbi:MAG: NADPH-dependent FMN reductase, partial [Candidatus Micrarchaeia archaeon]